MSDGIDLNLDNYELQDLLNLFKLDYSLKKITKPSNAWRQYNYETEDNTTMKRAHNCEWFDIMKPRAPPSLRISN